MRQVPKTEEIAGDRGIDRLLRLESRQKPAPGGGCADFDPDLASAYAERVLTAAENKHYETHLAQCAPCRRVVTVLIRTAEPVSPILDRKPEREIVAAGSSESWLRRLAGALMTPQWGLAAAAVLVLAIALPLVFSSRNGIAPSEIARYDGQQAAPPQAKAEGAPDAAAQAQVPALRANTPVSEKDASAATVSGVGRGAAEPAATPTGAGGGGSGASAGFADARAAGDKSPGVDQSAEKREEARQNEASARDALLAQSSEARKKDEAGKKEAQSEPAAPQAPAPAPETLARSRQSELAKIDERQAQRMPQQDHESARVQVLKQGRADAGGEREQKDAKIRPEDAVPPPPPPSASPDRRARTTLAQPPRMAITESSGARGPNAKANPPPRKETKGKTFWLRDDIWTDKDYNPTKELPVITLVRDSDVYREVLAKRGGLKPFFQLFSGNDRAIVVYKGTVYKIIPQDAAR